MQKIIINKKVHHITGGIILSNKTVSLTTLRIPSHVRSFSCQQCGSCCLEKWRIEIDPATYNQVAAIYQSQQQDNVFHELMTKDDQGKSYMKFSNGRCAALTPENLCIFQKNLGEEYLSDTCKVYPRRIFASSRGIEFALTFSCPAALQVLLNPEPITIHTEEASQSTFHFMRPRNFLCYVPENAAPSSWSFYYYQVEPLLLAVLQSRTTTIEQRLLQLGALFTRLQAITPSPNWFEAIPKELHYIPVPPERKEKATVLFRQLLLVYAKSAPPFANTLAYLLHHWDPISTTTPLTQYIAKTKESLEQLQFPQKAYWSAEKTYWQTTQASWEHILENYFANFVLGKFFFFQSWQEAYLRMVTLYGFIKFLSISYAHILNKPVGPDILLPVIQEIDQSLNHSNTFFQKLSERINNQPLAVQTDVALTLSQI